MPTKSSNAAERLAELNEKHCVVRMGGSVRIFSWDPSSVDPNQRVPSFTSPAAMRHFYANKFIKIVREDPDGQEKTNRAPVYEVWMESSKRPTAIGTIIDPNAERFSGEMLNLWRGWGLEPAPGSWPLIRQHIEQVVCGGNLDDASYLLRWIAWKVQHPTLPPEVALVLRGRKGTGKGTLVRLLMMIFGHHGLQISDRKHLVGSFNAHFLKCLLLNADEALWPGSKQDEGPLKRLVTEPTLSIEPKGVDLFDAPNMLGVILTGNADWMVPASDDERRYAVFDVADTYLQDFAYFDALRVEMRDGGAAAFLHDMLAMDLDGWHPRQDVPQTSALAEQKMESAGAEVHWLGSVLREGALPFSVRDESGCTRQIVHKDHPNLARSQLLYKHAKSADRRLQHLSEPAFHKFLDEHSIHPAENMRSSAGRYRRFPPLPEVRALFCQIHNWWPAFADDQDHWEFAPEADASRWAEEDFDPERIEQDEEAAG